MKDVVNILNDMTTDWEVGFKGKIGPDTSLVADLAFESIDVVQLAVALEEHFGQEGLPFEKMLMTEGRYVDDLRVDQVVSFLADHLRG
ncbi:MAG TPA: phosphopantetheine-binding protein [Methylomirabilota bacterium]|nr:phosphopantetheine-binding protein [Methylomirabilota bacterium]